MPLDDWLAQYWRNPLLTHEGSFAVLHEGRPVTVTLVRADGDRAMNDMTGTLRPFRGRGLARLVKLCQLEWAARNGIVAVVTENDEKNAPMLAVNTQLGYRPFLELSSYARELRVIRERRDDDDAAIAQIIRDVAPDWVTSEARRPPPPREHARAARRRRLDRRGRRARSSAGGAAAWRRRSSATTSPG